jgi:hypothetical protein
MRMEKEQEKVKIVQLQCDETIGWKDVVAIMIAQFQILMPIILGAALVMGLLLFIIMNIWVKN